MCLPLRTLTLRTSYLNLWCARLVVRRHFLFARSRECFVLACHMFAPCRTLTLRTSLYTLKYSQIYIYRMIDTFVYELKFCEFTYVSALASAHFEGLCIQAHIYNYIYILYIYICIIA